MSGRASSVGAVATALLLGLSMAACSSGKSNTNSVGTTTSSVSPTTGLGPTTTTTTIGTQKSIGTATSDDGMVYTVTDARRFPGAEVPEVVAIGFTIKNTSSQAHEFDFEEGVNAVTSDGQVVQSTSDVGQASGDPRCYDSNNIDPGSGIAPATYLINPGETFNVPKEFCFEPGAGLKVTQVTFADQDASNNAVVTLNPPV